MTERFTLQGEAPVNVRAFLIFLVIGFIGLLLVLGTFSLVRWLKTSYPHHFRFILALIVLSGFGLGAWAYMEAKERPGLHAGDLLTLGEPLVVRVIPTERLVATRTCIVEIHEHLSVVDVGSGTLKARVESNTTSGPSFCPIGAVVQFDLAWLHRYTLTHRHEEA
jgi:hypothetical protein